jgi:hypothetical protein
MGLVLVVFPAGRFQATRQFPLNGEKMTVGSAADARVPIDGANIRAQHASFSCRGGEWFIIGDDQCSVGDVPLAEDCARVVRAGDPIRVGEVAMVLQPSTAAGGAVPISEDDVTHLRPPPWPTVRVTEGPSVGHVVGLKEEGRTYVVGRGDKCDLKLDDRNVSREHVEITRTPKGILVQDRTSTRGTWLGSTRLVPNRRARWDGRRMVKLGATVLVLDEPQERAMGSALHPSQAPPPMSPHPNAGGIAYEDEGRDALAVPSGPITSSGMSKAAVLTPLPPPGAPSVPPLRRTAPPPSAAKAVLKVFALLGLALLVALLIAVVALLAR